MLLFGVILLVLIGVSYVTNNTTEAREKRISNMSSKDFVICTVKDKRYTPNNRSGFHTMTCVFEDAPEKELFCITGFQSTSCNWERYNGINS